MASAALGAEPPELGVPGGPVPWAFRPSRAPAAVPPCAGHTMHPCPRSRPPCDPSPSCSLEQGVCRAPGQPRGEALPWLAELLGVSLKAHWEVGEGSESQAWHTLGFRSASCRRRPGPSPGSLGSSASTPTPPEVSCWSGGTGRRGWERDLPRMTAGAACPRSDGSLLRQPAQSSCVRQAARTGRDFTPPSASLPSAC